MRKRDFLKASGALIGSTVVPTGIAAAESAPAPITDSATPIDDAEREQRLQRAQALMSRHDIDALVLEPGSSMTYFSGVNWWRSERLTAVVVPREGRLGVVTPYFEEPSVRESLALPADVRTWHEHENPFELLAALLRERKIRRGNIGIERTVRFFVSDGLRRASPGSSLVAADPVVDGCRMFKSPAELALMQRANDITMAAYRHVYPRVATGMTPGDIADLMNQATRVANLPVPFCGVPSPTCISRA